MPKWRAISAPVIFWRSMSNMSRTARPCRSAPSRPDSFDDVVSPSCCAMDSLSSSMLLSVDFTVVPASAGEPLQVGGSLAAVIHPDKDLNLLFRQGGRDG